MTNRKMNCNKSQLQHQSEDHTNCSEFRWSPRDRLDSLKINGEMLMLLSESENATADRTFAFENALRHVFA